jgi:hypothetical protein
MAVLRFSGVTGRVSARHFAANERVEFVCDLEILNPNSKLFAYFLGR